MHNTDSVYRKNFWLISVFLFTISVTLIVALVLGYRSTSINVDNDFYSRKNEILEKTTINYSDLFNERIPKITSYNGYMDSASAAGYAATVFNDFPFVTRIVFYKIGIGNQSARPKGDLGIVEEGIYQFTLDEDVLITTMLPDHAKHLDLEPMMDKLKHYVANADTTRGPNDTEQFKTFYDIKPNKISYLNIPRPAEIKAYREVQKSGNASIIYPQNMMTFFLDPTQMQVKNNHPELYKEVAVKQLVYDPLDNSGDKKFTDAPFPGALSDYKLVFRANKSDLQKEVWRQFMPIAGGVALIYTFLVLIGWLIFRNLAVNMKMFKLQYDFINNFTHEFKTPVSVIKIAGSNIRGEAELTERQRKHYGKILDEEADKLNDLMNKLLSFTQIENRSIKIKVEEIDVEEFVTRYINTFKIKYPDLDLKHTTGKGVNTFFTDPVLLGSIFQNLIENAYKYSNPDRKELLITILLEKRNIVFSFADKGIGIPKSEIANVFKKFYRIENKYNQNGSVGLGLAFVKELVNFMNGQITVKSKVSEGSEFVVSLPYEN
ncbi:sensor histidine kinase [Mucilaginibacter myungsuensis]|uniref:histidine kinase n=1 Tax=Mucilaginibacter myungsuensis TaxID=649104 RepID=A0A929PZB3_9SPHI|nr:HAMP domain-containing sensor histidine kinase [Mucilaginibacter myungsuensis]MBE9664237.1 HAMP domain-containing histidine kinase [Mucilaginibacter myungsuensis]MDN3599941.1 HAMP domain-containing sensor histidine kinase [Mucilaginibacter myungsuensis]